MPNTPSTDFSGADICLGHIPIAVAWTPVQITSAIDSAGDLAPDKSNKAGGPLYPRLRFQQLIFQAVKPDGSNDLIDNTTNVYIVRKGAVAGDTGFIVAVIKPGQTFFLASAPKVSDTFNPYRYYVTGLTVGDGVLVTGITQG